MPTIRHCEFCSNAFPRSASLCPHCARPALYPNVAAAEDDDEIDALDRRYEEALTESGTRGADHTLRDFESAAANSRAVLARSPGDFLRLANSDRDLFATYYQLKKAGLRLQVGDEWDYRRQAADLALLPGFAEHITFAALSLDGVGLSNYGSYSIMLRSDMIAHRATVFEENSVIFTSRHWAKMEKGEVPHGYRATWVDRGKLCVAKLHKSIDARTARGEYSKPLMRAEKSSEDDEFVEVHIFGPWTARTIEQVSVSKRKKKADNISTKWLDRELKKFGVTVKAE